MRMIRLQSSLFVLPTLTRVFCCAHPVQGCLGIARVSVTDPVNFLALLDDVSLWSLRGFGVRVIVDEDGLVRHEEPINIFKRAVCGLRIEEVLQHWGSVITSL